MAIALGERMLFSVELLPCVMQSYMTCNHAFGRSREVIGGSTHLSKELGRDEHLQDPAGSSLRRMQKTKESMCTE